MITDQCDSEHNFELLRVVILDLTMNIQCDLVCNDGFVYSNTGKQYARCHLNPRKNDETWFPNPKKISAYAQCVPDIAETCDSFPAYKDLRFFLLNNEQVMGLDGYSDDDLPKPELQAMFSGKLSRSNDFTSAESQVFEF